LYVSSLSSCLGAQYGAPRVLQCLSKENVVPLIKPLGKGGNGKKSSYGSGAIEKHDFGDVEFSQPDATEKDDSKEKENLSKDDSSAEDRSPLDMDYNKLETKLDLEEGDAELAEIESQSDSAPLLEKQDNKDSNAEEGTKDTKDRTREKRKERKKEDYYHEEHEIKWEIEKKPSSFYSELCNRWVSLGGAFASVLIMFLINWGYALANISVALIVYIYIGQANPGLSKGCASEFVFSKWLQSLWEKLTRKESSQQQIVVPVSGIPYQMSTYQLTEENTDFSYRDKRHQSSMVTSIGPQ